MAADSDKRLIGIETLAERWDLSKYSVRRLVTCRRQLTFRDDWRSALDPFERS